MGRRLLLIANGKAQNVTPYGREVIAKALSAEFDFHQVQTGRPGHAISLARSAAEEGVDIVVAHGGDGTVNEVANGLAGTETAMGILPGGLANVFARSLGIPEDAVEAAGMLLERIGSGAPARQVPLGKIDDRYFVANAGVGFDATIVRQVERRQGAKKRGGELFFVWTGVRVFFTGYDRRRPKIHLEWGTGPTESRDGLFLTIFQNTTPYTYLGEREMRLCPDATLAGGIDCFALDTMRTRSVLPMAISSFARSRRIRRSKHALLVKDRQWYVVTCEAPMLVQVDGELIGERDRMRIESVPDALLVFS